MFQSEAIRKSDRSATIHDNAPGRSCSVKDEQIQKISSVVHESVEGSLKKFKSYSQAVQSQSEAPQTMISSAALQKVLKSVAQGGNRAKNVNIFGFEESSSEELLCRVQVLSGENWEKEPGTSKIN